MSAPTPPLPRTPEQEASARALLLLLAGAVLLLVGFTLAAISWPVGAIEVDEYGEVTETSMAGPIVGAAIALAGTLVLAVPLIAWGVRLGLSLPRR